MNCKGNKDTCREEKMGCKGCYYNEEETKITMNADDLRVENLILKIDTIESLKLPKYKSTMEIGNIQVNNIKHFNWMQKLFWKILLGIKIKDIKE